MMSGVLKALVVSSNDELRKELAGTLQHYGMCPLPASSVVQGLCVLSGHSIDVVFCEDRLIDGDYLHFVDGAKRIAPKVALVVVTQAFDINEHAIAIASGVFDHVGWPPHRSEIERVLQNTLQDHDRWCSLPAEQASP
jgi:DNA-binding NtrC family response regulator